MKHPLNPSCRQLAVLAMGIGVLGVVLVLATVLR